MEVVYLVFKYAAQKFVIEKKKITRTMKIFPPLIASQVPTEPQKTPANKFMNGEAFLVCFNDLHLNIKSFTEILNSIFQKL